MGWDILNKIISFPLKAATLGCHGRIDSSENRLNIITNALGIWTVIGLFSIRPFLKENGLLSPDYNYVHLGMFTAAIMILSFNRVGLYGASRITALLTLNIIGYQSAIIFGKTFNGYYVFFLAIFYSIVVTSKYPSWIKWPSILMSLAGLPIVDYFTHSNQWPITQLNSHFYPLSVILVDTLVISSAIAVAVYVEKYQSDVFESKLDKLNKNLEKIITQRTEQLVEAKNEAENASLMKSQFVANTSHELRTPVQGSTGFTALAVQQLKNLENLSPENEQVIARVNRSLDMASKSNDRLLTLIDKVLNLTRSERSNFKALPVKVSPKKILEQAGGELTYLARQKEMIIVQPPVVLSSFVMSDPVLLTQIVSNLISNAIRYGQAGTNIQLKLEENPTHFMIHICNKGPGIEPDDVDKLFEPFVQGTRTDKTVGGTGLGLAMCRRYAKAMDATLTITDTSPENTTFTITHPYIRPSKAQPPHKGTLTFW